MPKRHERQAESYALVAFSVFQPTLLMNAHVTAVAETHHS